MNMPEPKTLPAPKVRGKAELSISTGLAVRNASQRTYPNRCDRVNRDLAAGDGEIGPRSMNVNGQL